MRNLTLVRGIISFQVKTYTVEVNLPLFAKRYVKPALQLLGIGVLSIGSLIMLVVYASMLK